MRVFIYGSYEFSHINTKIKNTDTDTDTKTKGDRKITIKTQKEKGIIIIIENTRKVITIRKTIRIFCCRNNKF